MRGFTSKPILAAIIITAIIITAVAVAVAVALVPASPASAQPWPGVTRLLSVGSDQVQGDHDSQLPSVDEGTVAGPVSDDGRRVAFVSRSTDLGGPADFRDNVYVFDDRSNGRTRLVSVGNSGAEGDLDSPEPAMNSDGDLIVFASRASAFVPENQGFFASDIFIRIRK